MKKKLSVIAVSLLAALPLSAYAAGCGHNTAEDFSVCVNSSCFSKTVDEEKAKDIIDSILSGKPIQGSSEIADAIEAWLKENSFVKPPVNIEKPDNKPEEKPEEAPDYNKPEDKPETDNDAENVPPQQDTTPEKPGSGSGSGSVENSAFVNEVIRLVNVQRNKSGLASLSADSALNSASSVRAKEIVKAFSHTRPDGRSCFTALSDIGYSYRHAGENIAYGQQSPSEVVNAWMNSEGHRANILSSNFTKIGVGCHSNGGTYYWAQFFAG